MIDKNREFVQSHYEKGKLYNLEAVRLWQQGNDKWNKWVEENPECDVDFSKIDFGYLRRFTEDGIISFLLYTFPKGNVNFDAAEFGKGDVNFQAVEFDEGDVNFVEARFGEGNVYFSGANFGEGDVDFSETNFGNGNVSFLGVFFSDGDVIFTKSEFGNGDVDFSLVNAGNGDVLFVNVIFKCGTIIFGQANWGSGEIDFSNSKFNSEVVSFFEVDFGKSSVNFSEAYFQNSYVVFSGSKFREGDLLFFDTNFGAGKLNLSYMRINGNVFLSNLTDSERIESISFNGVSIDGSMSLYNNKFKFIPDLTQTNIKHEFELQSLEISLFRERSRKTNYFLKSVNPKHDVKCLRKLRQIAENNKHHEAALRFHADEMRAKRWQKPEDGGFGILGSILDLLYSAACDYGQSISRPILGLVFSWGAFLPVYWLLANNNIQSNFANWLNLAIFTSYNPIPFIPVAKQVRESALEKFFTDNLPYVYLSMGLQSIVTIVFLFLLGLGLRNRFRI